MEILLENKSDRVFVTEYGVQTIVLGDGCTIISDVDNDDFHGICFSESPKPEAVGFNHESMAGKTVVEIGAYLQILTDNPASLDVIISKCELAKARLLRD